MRKSPQEAIFANSGQFDKISTKAAENTML